MISRLVVNSSPLISIAGIKCLDVIFPEKIELIIPEQVYAEIMAGPSYDAAKLALINRWRVYETVGAHVPLDMEVAEWSLGAGETAVLSYARLNDCVAVIDDLAARKAASTMNIRCIGTLGLIIRAKVEKRIESAAELLKIMKSKGFRLDDHIIYEALKKTTEEEWQ